MENRESSVCIVMPVYNGAKTIELAIKSLLFQTYTNWNCVIVNDGSTDETKVILDKLTDIRFKIIHLDKNKGRGNARQVCLDNSSGDYLAFLDADDFYHPDKLKLQVDILSLNPDIQLVSCGIGSYDDKNKLRTIRGIKFSGIQKFNTNEDIKFTPATSMVFLKFAKNIKYNQHLNASEDIDFLNKLLIKKKYFILNEILYYYFEFESLSYLKTIDYNYNSIKRIIINRNNTNKFLKQLIYKFLRMLFYIVFYPILGKEFFLKRRGIKPTSEQIKTFDSLINVLKN
jgi:glycosyltransferase involved in cell wall biosynthesis